MRTVLAILILLILIVVYMPIGIRRTAPAREKAVLTRCLASSVYPADDNIYWWVHGRFYARDWQLFRECVAKNGYTTIDVGDLEDRLNTCSNGREMVDVDRFYFCTGVVMEEKSD